jgi:plastocyanin
MNFPLSHIASLCKYTGISFTAGAITHGFFSGERAIWTAVFGVAIYLVGGTLEKIANPDRDHSWTDVLAIGIVASIGLGFFTGGLQHFPDSPARSSWVVPVGFAMSLLAIYLMEGKGKVKIKGVLIYGGISLALVIAASLYSLSYFKEHGGDGHGHSHDHGIPPPQVLAPSMKEIRIEVDDTMRFIPATWEAQAGEPIRIILVNKGKVDHELVIGTEKEIIAHAKEMASPGAKPGQQAELVWTFKKSGQYVMACFEPGHYEAGMKGVINVVAHQR